MIITRRGRPRVRVSPTVDLGAVEAEPVFGARSSSARSTRTVRPVRDATPAMSAPRTTRASATATERGLAINLQDAQSLLRRYGLGPPLVTASGPGGTFAAAVCVAHADATPWLVVADRDEEEHGEHRGADPPAARRMPQRKALAAGGIAAHACAARPSDQPGARRTLLTPQGGLLAADRSSSRVAPRSAR